MSVTTLQALIICATGLLLILMMITDFLRHKVDLLSIRNIMLLGFLIYQVVSPAAVLFTEYPQAFRIDDLEYAGWKYIGLMIPFLLVFLVSYRFGWFVKKLANNVPMYNKELSDTTMILAVVIGTVIAVIARLIPAPIAVAYALYFVALGSSTMSTGLVTWWWMRRPLNVMRASISIFVLLINILIVIYGAFSRRPLIAVMLMLVWVLYYTRFRYTRSRIKLVTLLTIAALPLIIFSSLFTSVRQQDYREKGSIEIVKAMFLEGDIANRLVDGFVDQMGGQLVGEASLWCTEAFPDHVPQDHLLSLRYYFVANVPRDLWPDKPYVLSTRVADLADIQGVNQDRAQGGKGVTLPPGIVGYIAAEGGLYAAIVYGLVLGLVSRFMDQLVVNNPHHAGMAIPIAASLGNVLGLLRGDPSTFAMAATWAILASFTLIFIISSLIGRRRLYKQGLTPHTI